MLSIICKSKYLYSVGVANDTKSYKGNTSHRDKDTKTDQGNDLKC